MMLEEWAAAVAERLLSPLGDRWKHVRAVGECAREVSAVLDEEDRPYLVAAAYLHDIGYAPKLQRTGLHQLDGARYMSTAEQLASGGVAALEHGLELGHRCFALQPQAGGAGTVPPARDSPWPDRYCSWSVASSRV
jgi:hypothetical protein